jgi:hypothetical protein
VGVANRADLGRRQHGLANLLHAHPHGNPARFRDTSSQRPQIRGITSTRSTGVRMGGSAIERAQGPSTGGRTRRWRRWTCRKGRRSAAVAEGGRRALAPADDPDGRGGVTGPGVVGSGSFTRTDRDDNLSLPSLELCTGDTLTGGASKGSVGPWPSLGLRKICKIIRS